MDAGSSQGMTSPCSLRIYARARAQHSCQSRPLSCYASRRRATRRAQGDKTNERKPHGDRIFHDALASAGVRTEGGPRLGPSGAALARRARLSGSLDRRAPHRAVGAASVARSAGGAGVAADQEHPPRPRRLPAALSPPRRTRQPRRDARSSLRRPAQFRRRRVRPAERLGDVQCRRHVRPEPRHDPRGAGDHPEDVDRGRARGPTRANSGR